MAEQYSLTLDDVRDGFSFISCQCDRYTWVTLGMSVKSEFGDSAFDAWDSWSSGYEGKTKKDSYNPGKTRRVWNGFKGGKTRIGTFIDAALAAGWRFPDQQPLSPEEKAKKKAEQAERDRLNKLRWEEEEKQAAALQARVAELANEIWGLLEQEGQSDYIERKQIKPFAARFVKYGMVVVTDEGTGTAELIRGSDNITAFFNTYDEDHDPPRDYYRAGYLVLPLYTIDGCLVNLQFITPKGTKLFMRCGQKSGTYLPIGSLSPSKESPAPPLCCVEGYATGATIHMATGWPVAIGWDAGNLKTIVPLLHKKHPQVELLVCGDNDSGTENNPGLTAATEAARLVKGRCVVPDFSEVISEETTEA